VPVRELAGGRGVDLVVEVGGAGTLEKSLKSVAAEGHVSMVGWLASEVSTIDVAAFSAMAGTIRRIAVGSRAQFIAMNRAIAAHQLKPAIDCVFAFDAAAKASRYYDAGKYFGKVVISHG
jgi:NADPH:quinone reductase-like Zn-dependent oxidoreductase